MTENIDTSASPDPEVQQPGHYSLSDLGNADRFREQWHNIARYCYERKKWLIWDDLKGVWIWDTGPAIAELAHITVRDILQEAHDENDYEIRKQLINHSLKSESDTRIHGMINQAQSMMFIKPSQLERNQYIFNCKNGTIELKTGILRPHSILDYTTILVPINYNPEAKCPNWLSFMDWITGSDKELIAYIQRAIGYSMSGDIAAQVIFMLYGLGSNGKSTLSNVIRKLLGGYAGRLEIEDILLKDRPSDNAKPGIADLENKRFVITSEIPKKRKLNTGLVKDISGETTIKARRLYEDGHEFELHVKLWLQGNHMPEISDNTLSIWRRVKLIKCEQTIDESKRIDSYEEKMLYPELEGILVWAVQGAVEYFENGLGHAEAIRTATDKYRHDSDKLADFFEDCNIVIHPGLAITKKEFKEKYTAWCAENGIEVFKQNDIKALLGERGVFERKSGSIRKWLGIGEPENNGTEGTKETEITQSFYTRDFLKEKFTENGLKLSHSKLTWDKTLENSLPDCPECGKNEWEFVFDGKTIKCPCGYEMENPCQ